MKMILRFLKWRYELARAARKAPRYAPEYAEPDIARIHNPDPQRIQATWVGHSTFLIQVAGMNILTDPIWSKRASPVQFAGPKRQARPGIRFEDLPKIDVVLISHTHYDHLDRGTILRLDDAPTYVLPDLVGNWFRREGIANIKELSWWQDTQIGPLKISAAPAKHWSKRKVFGIENEGWGGYLIESPAGTIFFAGDTGYHEQYFKEIGNRFPNIDLALIPIGAYHPRQIFARFHIDPVEAITVHKEIGAKRSIGMHWGVFKLTHEPLDEPPKLLARERAAANLRDDEFSTMRIGETRTIDFVDKPPLGE